MVPSSGSLSLGKVVAGGGRGFVKGWCYVGSNYKTSFETARAGNGHATSLPTAFLEEFPTISEILQGSPAEGEGTYPVPPASVVIFAESGDLKFCITPKLGNRVAFGVWKDPGEGLRSLERILGAGEFEWKISKARQRGGSQ
jgi:hypothetical protein